MKKLISVLLCSSTLLTGAAAPVLAQEETTPVLEMASIMHRGKIGTADWTIDSNGTLTIGEGEFTNYDAHYNWPWRDYLATEITHVNGSANFKVNGTLVFAFYSGNQKENKIKSMDLSGWDISSVTSTQSMFLDCKSVKSMDLSGWNMSSVTDIMGMFRNCSSLESLDLSMWDTSSVKTMWFAFSGCTSLSALNLAEWNTSSVTGTRFMFEKCSSLKMLDLSGWDTSSVKTLEGMFSDCHSLETLDVSNWNTSSVGSFEGNTKDMFNNCSSLSNIRYPESARRILSELPDQTGWYQNGKGPYSISSLPAVTAGKTALLTRTATNSPSSQNPPAASAKKATMHRLYNPNSGEHFYTSNTREKDHLVSVGWKYEGEGWKAPEKSSIPVYRLYNPNAGDHHYTLDKNEKDSLVKIGWNDEGIGWYSDEAKGVPLYRQYNPNAKAGSHNYTTDKNENDGLVKLGWKAEGIGWYGLK